MRVIRPNPSTTNEPTVRPLGYQPSLDGLRAIAVVSVVVFHLHESSAPGGWAGVQLFFVLSGFLITSLLLSESSATGGISIGRFWMRRVLRLFPALVAMLVTYAALQAITSGAAAGRYAVLESLRAMTYGYNWFTVSAGHWFDLGHLWPLSVEEQFYVAWPLIVAVVLHGLRRNQHQHQRQAAPNRTKHLVAFTVVGVVASAAWQGYLMAHGRDIRAVAGTDASAYSILIGCLLAEIRSLRLPGARALERARPWATPIGLVAYLTVAFFVDDTGFAIRVVVTLASLFMVIGLIDGDNDPLSRAFATRPMRAIGRVSYGLYLWHIPAIILTTRLVREVGLPTPTKYPLALIGTAVATVVSYRFVEQPFLRMKHRFEAPTGAPAPAPAPT